MSYNSTDAFWTPIKQHMHPHLIYFFSLSYQRDTPSHPDSYKDSTYYGTGILDLYLIFTIIAVMAILRDVLRLYFFEPLARWVLTNRLERQRARKRELKTNGSAKPIANGNGHSHSHNNPILQRDLNKIHRSVLRFAEQGWSFVYYTVQWSFGFYVNMNLPTQLFDASTIWAGYPHHPLPGTVKLYYLMQLAFYLHQILIINAEARRKDHFQMLTHHVITVLLMGLSYYMNFTRVGCLIMVLMDWCDIFLPLAKMIRYLSISQFACDCTFAIFLISWFITRHVLFLFVIRGVHVYRTRLDFIWDPPSGSFLCKKVWHFFTGLLISLQILQLIWFWMICRVAWRVVTGKGAADERSDEEGDDKDD